MSALAMGKLRVSVIRHLRGVTIATRGFYHSKFEMPEQIPDVERVGSVQAASRHVGCIISVCACGMHCQAHQQRRQPACFRTSLAAMLADGGVTR